MVQRLGTRGWGQKGGDARAAIRCRVLGARGKKSRCEVPGAKGQKSGCLGILCGPPAGGLPPARSHCRECAKRDEKPATAEAAQQVKRQLGI